MYLCKLNRAVGQDGLKIFFVCIMHAFSKIFFLGFFYGSDYTKMKDTFLEVTFMKQY